MKTNPLTFHDRSKATRLSHSTLEILHRCERLYQLKRLLRNADPMAEADEGSEHLFFGKAFGAGIQSYLLHQDPQRALYDAWLEYFPQIESEKKNQPRLQALLAKAFIQLDSLLMEYEVETSQDISEASLSPSKVRTITQDILMLSCVIVSQVGIMSWSVNPLA